VKHAIITLLLLAGFTALSTMQAGAVVCAVGVYHAGCVAGGVRHPYAARGRVVVAPHRVVIRR
jgi:hypothetical protein